MFHCPLETVKGVLVQAPWDCFGPRSTTSAPEAGVDVGTDEAVLPAAVVGVCAGGAVVADAPVLPGVVPPAPDSAGRERDPPPPEAVFGVDPPVGKQLPRSIPMTSVPMATSATCQGLNEIRSLILS